MHLESPPQIADIAARFDGDLVVDAIQAPPEPAERGAYLHWDKLRHLTPESGLPTDLWWLRIKLARIDEFRQLPLRTVAGRPFAYTVPAAAERHLHRIDQRAGGVLGMGTAIPADRDSRRRYLVSSLEEEAIRSSQMEGAMTSRVAAKELLRTGREPQDKGERMIANNYAALRFMLDEPGDSLTPERVLEVHRILAQGTLDDPAGAGRLQPPDEKRVRVFYRDEDDPIHVPPPAEELPERLQALCDFANEGEDEEEFVHPVLRAILVHFVLAYDHPFVDGNGRTARILFFWMMRERGYWLSEYLPISRILGNARRRYTRAFLETETDGGDVTYFLLHQLGVIEQAIVDLDAYLSDKQAERRAGERLLDADEDLNGRQVVLLTHALKHPDHAYTFAGHAHSNRVTHETARSDLGGLAERGLLARRKRGRTYVFEPPADLPERLRESPA
jgi:Fic family protein